MSSESPITEEIHKAIRKAAWLPVALTVVADIWSAPDYRPNEGILLPVVLLAVILDIVDGRTKGKHPNLNKIVRGLWLGFGLSMLAKFFAVMPGTIAKLF